MKQVTPLSARMKFIGILHTGRIRRIVIQRHSQLSSPTSKKDTGEFKGVKAQIESD